MELSQEVKNDIEVHALKLSPQECCGFVIFHDFLKKMVAIRANNVAQNKIREVNFDPKDILNVKFLGKLLGLYHSHNSENSFSQLDKLCYDIHKVPIILYNVPNRKFSIYQGEDYLNNKYCGRDFVFRVSDCYNLIIDYYKEELGIIIEDYFPNRDNNWYKNEINYIEKFINKTQFIYVPPTTLQKNDIIVIGNKTRFHFGIYLDNNIILHQPRNKKSCIEVYNQSQKENTIYGLRHIKFNTI